MLDLSLQSLLALLLVWLLSECAMLYVRADISTRLQPKTNNLQSRYE